MTSIDDLRSELLAVSGVAGADITGNATDVSGVKVRLEPGADADGVGQQVRAILARHGVSASVSPPPTTPGGPPPPPGAAAPVVAIADFDAAPPRPRPGVVRDAALDGVSVEETAEGVVVVARAADGRQALRRAPGGDAGLAEGVVAAIAELIGEPSPAVLGTDDAHLGGTRIVTVALELPDGRRVAGAAVVTGGLPFALAQAAWTALTA